MKLFMKILAKKKTPLFGAFCSFHKKSHYTFRDTSSLTDIRLDNMGSSFRDIFGNKQCWCRHSWIGKVIGCWQFSSLPSIFLAII